MVFVVLEMQRGLADLICRAGRPSSGVSPSLLLQPWPPGWNVETSPERGHTGMGRDALAAASRALYGVHLDPTLLRHRMVEWLIHTLPGHRTGLLK